MFDNMEIISHIMKMLEEEGLDGILFTTLTDKLLKISSNGNLSD
jgi:hypothetical protein